MGGFSKACAYIAHNATDTDTSMLAGGVALTNVEMPQLILTSLSEAV